MRRAGPAHAAEFLLAAVQRRELVPDDHHRPLGRVGGEDPPGLGQVGPAQPEDRRGPELDVIRDGVADRPHPAVQLRVPRGELVELPHLPRVAGQGGPVGPQLARVAGDQVDPQPGRQVQHGFLERVRRGQHVHRLVVLALLGAQAAKGEEQDRELGDHHHPDQDAGQHRALGQAAPHAAALRYRCGPAAASPSGPGLTSCSHAPSMRIPPRHRAPASLACSARWAARSK